MRRALTLAILLGGCAVGPRYVRPAPPTTEAYLTTAVPPQIVPGEIPVEWWRDFGSPELDRLVAMALTANSDLQVAEATLRQSRQEARAAGAALLPTIDAGLTSERSKSSNYLSPVLNAPIFDFTLQTAQVSVSYPLDLFGGARRAIESARAATEGQYYRTAAARLTVTTNVVVAAVQEASLREQLAAARGSVTANASLLTLLERRQALGALGLADVAPQAAALGQAEAAVPALEKALVHQQAALSILLGRDSSQPLPATVELDHLVLPQVAPLRLPSELVRQRPDIRAAAAALHGASADVGVTIAARLPAILLTAAGGGASPNFADLFRNGNPFWQVIGGITQPLFHGGQLLHRQRAAEAALDGAKAQYQSTVLSAFVDVSDALTAIRSDDSALRATTRADSAAQQSLRFTHRQVELGAGDTLTALVATATAAQTSLALIQVRAARFADRAALVQALGGPATGPLRERPYAKKPVARHGA